MHVNITFGMKGQPKNKQVSSQPPVRQLSFDTMQVVNDELNRASRATPGTITPADIATTANYIRTSAGQNWFRSLGNSILRWTRSFRPPVDNPNDLYTENDIRAYYRDHWQDRKLKLVGGPSPFDQFSLTELLEAGLKPTQPILPLAKDVKDLIKNTLKTAKKDHKSYEYEAVLRRLREGAQLLKAKHGPEVVDVDKIEQQYLDFARKLKSTRKENRPEIDSDNESVSSSNSLSPDLEDNTPGPSVQRKPDYDDGKGRGGLTREIRVGT